jgi:hypothetical protein
MGSCTYFFAFALLPIAYGYWDQVAAAFALRGVDRLEGGDLAGAIDDYYSARVESLATCNSLKYRYFDVATINPRVAIDALQRLIHEHPGSSSTDLDAGFKDRARKDPNVHDAFDGLELGGKPGLRFCRVK